MTTPLSVGYPDYRRSFATSRFFTTVANAVAFNSTTVFGPYSTVNMDSIAFSALTAGGRGLITLGWFFDIGLTQNITSEQISLIDPNVFEQSIVVKGPFLSVTIAPFAPTPFTLTLVLYETTRSVIPSPTPQTNVLFYANAIPVGAGATVTTQIDQVWCGEISWQPTSSLVTYAVHIDAVSVSALTQQLDFVDQTFPKSMRTIFLPPCTCNVVVTNTSGGAGNVGVRMTARPGMAGM